MPVKLTCLDCGQLNRVPDDKLGHGAKCGTCGAALMPSKPVEVDLATLEKAARNDGLPLVVDFGPLGVGRAAPWRQSFPKPRKSWLARRGWSS